ncbi:MAG: amidohydrolase family protein [Eubacteriales bacterium]|nr:amidohydrolase family protein [Eubacteriales bacterium]
MKITDAHVHYSPQTGPEFLTKFLDETGTDAAVMQAVSHSRCISLIPGALVMKHMNPRRFYVYGSPDLTGYYLNKEDFGEHMAWYTGFMMDCGCDGIKMLEGKPQMRKAHPVPDFDDICWEPFWNYAEEHSIPILWHVNDPETNWSPDASPWVKKQGWWYDDSFINNEVQYSQVLNVLSRHKNLKIVFAHFFFMSAQLDRLDEIMDKYPEIMVDMTPGIEMYENFSGNIGQIKAFFGKYINRIAYGTDIGGRCILTNEGDPFNRKENLRRPEIVRTFLKSDGETVVEADGNFIHDREPFVMKGLGLDPIALEAVLGKNIERFSGGAPGAVNCEKVLELCAYLRMKMIDMSDLKPDFRPDVSQIDMAERYFSDIIYE